MLIWVSSYDGFSSCLPYGVVSLDAELVPTGSVPPIILALTDMAAKLNGEGHVAGDSPPDCLLKVSTSGTTFFFYPSDEGVKWHRTKSDAVQSMIKRIRADISYMESKIVELTESEK